MQELENWSEEKQSAYLYRVIADAEKNITHKNLFTALSKEAEKQAIIWENTITKKGGRIPAAFKVDTRTRIVAKLIPYFGPKRLRNILTAMKVRGLSIYLKSDPGHPLPTAVSEIGKGHKSVNEGGNLRAAVFGVNDGLISNFSLLMGLAGAFSMAAGEYVSVRSQREMYEYQIALESEELKEYPEAEAAELALIYEARGLPKADAQKIATTIIQNPKQALDTLTREELGLNPEELGSPRQAAFFSFISFAVGGLIPLLPFLIKNSHDILFSAILTGVGLFATGAVLSLFTGRNALLNGFRILLIGAAAGAVTYLTGYILGVSLS